MRALADFQEQKRAAGDCVEQRFARRPCFFIMAPRSEAQPFYSSGFAFAFACALLTCPCLQSVQIAGTADSFDRDDVDISLRYPPCSVASLQPRQRVDPSKHACVQRRSLVFASLDPILIPFFLTSLMVSYKEYLEEAAR